MVDPFCYRTGGVAVVHNLVSFNGGPFFCRRCGKQIDPDPPAVVAGYGPTPLPPGVISEDTARRLTERAERAEARAAEMQRERDEAERENTKIAKHAAAMRAVREAVEREREAWASAASWEEAQRLAAEAALSRVRALAEEWERERFNGFHTDDARLTYERCAVALRAALGDKP